MTTGAPLALDADCALSACGGGSHSAGADIKTSAVPRAALSTKAQVGELIFPKQALITSGTQS